MNWDKLIDFFQELMIFILIIVVVVCIITLISFDVLAGTGIMMFLTNNQIQESVVISLATSGLLIALMFVGYSMTSGKSKILKGVGGLAFLLAAGVYCLDVFFDSLTADYLRFGYIVNVSTLPEGDVQLLFRLLIGGISTVGETLAVTIILGMPVLKRIVADALPSSQKEKKGDIKPQQNNRKPNRNRNRNIPEFLKRHDDVLNKLPKG